MRLISTVLSAAFAAATSLGLAHAAPTDTPDASSKGIPVRLRLEMDLRSGQDKVGEPVLFTVKDAVYGPNHSLLLAKGALAHGHVTRSSSRGAFGHNGKLTFTCDYAAARDGSSVPLLLTVEVRPAGLQEDSSSAGEVGAAATAGINTNNYDQSPAYYDDPQQTGTTAGIAVDSARLLKNGDDETAAKGQEFKAVLAASLPPAAALLTPQVITLRDKTQLTGTLLNFNGLFYLVRTSHGNQTISAADVASVVRLPDASHH